MASQIVFRFWKLIFFFQKVQHEVLNLEIQLILSILWVWHLKIGPKSKKLSENIKKTIIEPEKHEFEMSYNQNYFTNS